jgi:hypothetical protein
MRIVAFIPDLLFGSSVLETIRRAGHDVQLVSDPSGVPDADLLVVDLTAEPMERIDLVRPKLRQGLRTLAFYSHLEADVRTLAEEAGFDLVVPRSRMAREMPALVARLLGR